MNHVIDGYLRGTAQSVNTSARETKIYGKIRPMFGQRVPEYVNQVLTSLRKKNKLVRRRSRLEKPRRASVGSGTATDTTNYDTLLIF